jgi:hypothetical protein
VNRLTIRVPKLLTPDVRKIRPPTLPTGVTIFRIVTPVGGVVPNELQDAVGRVMGGEPREWRIR